MGAVADGEAAALRLRDQAPDVQADEQQRAEQRRHRDDPQDQQLFAREQEREQQDDPRDRARRPVGRQVGVPQNEGRHQRVTERADDPRHEVEPQVTERPQRALHDRTEAAQHVHVQEQMPQQIVREDRRHQHPVAALRERRPADQEVVDQERRHPARRAREQPQDEDDDVDGDKERRDGDSHRGLRT